MKHWISVTSLSLVLCFLFGAWWGHRLQEQKTARPKIKATLTIAAEKGQDLSPFTKRLFNDTQIQLIVKAYETPQGLIELAKATPPPDLILFPSYMFRALQHRELLGPLDVHQIPNANNISRDLRFAAWDSEENFAVPINWNALLFIYNPARFKPASESLAELLKSDGVKTKKVKASLKREVGNLVWLSQVLKLEAPNAEASSKEEWIAKLSNLPWEPDQYLEKFKKGEIDLLQLSWSELQNVRADLGEFKIWYPTEKTPFSLEFISLSKNSSNPSKAHAVIDQILDEEVYPSLITKETSAAVMDIKTKWRFKSAQYFRDLPLTQMRPLINRTYDVTDLDRAKAQIFSQLINSEKN